MAVPSGVGGWAGVGLAPGLPDPADGSGALSGYAAQSHYTAAGGQLTVFALLEWVFPSSLRIVRDDRGRSGRRLRLRYASEFDPCHGVTLAPARPTAIDPIGS